MDKLNFQKAIDSLKNTELNTKERIAKFDQIQVSLLALQNHSNYKSYLSSAVQILLLFCEDIDSNCRISAEENLNKIVRSVEKNQQIVLIQIDLYHELKKNGNERSLRICLSLFSHFSHLIKHRRRKVYAQNLLPCLLAIGKRREPLVIESFAEFMKSYSKNLLNCLTECETVKLVDLFIENLSVECAIRRRCSAQNILSIVEHSIKKESVMKTVLTKIQENLSRNHETNFVLGSLGLLRLLMPMLVASSCHHQKTLEVLETILSSLKAETNHSVINANLEALNSLLASAANSREFQNLLTDDLKLQHKEMLLSRRSMPTFINVGSRKSSDTETLKTSQENFLQIPSASTSVMSTPNKSLMDFSDVEGDSFKSIEFDEEYSSSSPAAMRNFIERGAETMSLKSTDSINSFFNTIASNTESVSKFFRKSSTESPMKMNESIGDEKSFDFSISQLKDENTELPDSQTLPETAEMALEDPKLDETLELEEETVEVARELYIGSLFDQSIVEYIVRLVSSKFLLEGTPGLLISDQIVRVSIKNLALSVIVACVGLKSKVLMLKMQKDFTDESAMVESLLSFLVDEDLRLEEEEKKPEAANTSESFLEIKDDHFGECTTATFLDYFSPISRSLDEQGLISLKNRIYEEKSKDREESAKKINRDLCQLLTLNEPTMETTMKMPDIKDCQFIVDVLMYSNHTDPVLRGNVYMIIGSFLRGVLGKNLDYEKFVAVNEITRKSLAFDKLLKLLAKGFKDEIHTVVKQTLSAVEDLVNLLILEISSNEILDFLNRLLMVFSNQYWLVQCKYADIVVKLDFLSLKRSIGSEKAENFQSQVMNQLYELIKDNDFRVRSHVSDLLPGFIFSLCNCDNSKSQITSHLSSFVNENLFNFAFFFDLKDQKALENSVDVQLTKVLYILTNFLLDVKHKNQHFGIIYALKILVRTFSPLNYTKAWREFNILSVLVSFINKNPGIALDISCQCDMIEVIGTLIGAGLTSPEANEFLLHLLRILNIFGHLLTNTKPVVVPKQKSKDIFMSSKELAMINSLGLFSSDHFYLKLFLVLKNSFESFRMTINKDAEVKLKQLLHVVLKSLQTLLELRTMTVDHVKLLEETVQYLNQIIAFQPTDCIVTTKILLKFLFQRNFVNRKVDLDAIQLAAGNNDAISTFEKYENFFSFEITRDITFETSIKQFDPLVIHGLRMFSKSSAHLQATILDMLCQLLEFNVNYMQLDAKKVFVDFVMRQIEYIESGMVIDGELLAPRIIQFLIFLTKLKDKKLITIPKIINIVDNLLAVATSSGVEALLVLTIELFFRKIVFKGEPEVVEVQNKEINAQREVVISMILKFLSHKKLQEVLVWIMVKSRVDPAIASVVNENEIHQQLVNIMKNNEAPAEVLEVVSKNILLDSKNFEGVLSLYMNLLEAGDVKAMETITVIQEQVMLKAEEVYLMNHVKLHQEKSENSDNEPLRNFIKLHLNFLIKNCEIHGKLDGKTRKFWRFMLFRKLPTFLEVLKENVEVANLLKPAASSLEVFNIAINFLMTIEVDIDRIKSSFDGTSANKGKLMEIYHRNLFSKRNDINAWQNEELMNFFKDSEKLEILLKFSQSVLLDSLLEDQAISKIIIKKLTMVKIVQERVKFLLENAHEDSLMDSLNFVMTKAAQDTKDSRILQLVMVKKLHSIKNEIIMGKDCSTPAAEDFQKLSSRFIDLKLHKKFPTFIIAIQDFGSFLKAKTDKDSIEINADDISNVVDESWLIEQAKNFVTGSKTITNAPQIASFLFEIKSESKLVTLLTSNDFNLKLLPATIRVAFEKMLKSFRIDCVQLNPHLNYMKIPPLLKISLLILMKNLESKEIEAVEKLAETLSIFLKFVGKLEKIALIYVDAKLVEKFISENLLKIPFQAAILKFLSVLVDRDWSEIVVEAIGDILVLNLRVDEETGDRLVDKLCWMIKGALKNSEFVIRYQHPPLFEEIPSQFNKQVETFKRIVFIAKIQESFEDGEFDSLQVSSKSRSMVKKVFDISRPLLRISKFYQFTLTPYEILLSYRSGDDLLMPQSEGNLKLKQIPIEYLSDSELLERYVRRINRYGFTQRQEFEEIFMTLLVLLNQWNEMQDAEEQFNIKQLCLQTNVELIISCFRFPAIGAAENSLFHFPRSEKIKLDCIGLKKLHHIQETLDSELNVFYRPNLERVGECNNIVNSKSFDMNQFSLNYSWQLVESREDSLSRNISFYHDKCGIDFKSALQLIYDLMTQMIDENPVLVLPNLVKIVDVLDNVDQFKWINRKMLSLYDSIAEEDTISHQHVAYLLCRSAAVLIPSLSELQQLQVIVNKYLSCNQVYVRNAALHGLLCLFESLCKTNTTMGGMSDEMKVMRNCIVNYTSRNGIVNESSITSPRHDKLVWSLNFYLIEMTSKFLPDCDLFGDTVISANNILKRTNDLEIFYQILNGLERLIILNPSVKLYREKIEKLALDLMKTENKLFAVGGLKLLVTCLYTGSLEQLENTEKSNGIVQDEPEIIMQSTEKIEILFTRIRTATMEEADVFGRVLGQILHDLLPPNEILTKVIKELLIMNQSNCVCIAKIIHQVFRSAIDSSYLNLLQEWLICSLQNFLTYPNHKKSIWFLSLIFLSSSLNQNLVKLYPILLDENIADSELHRIFLVSSKDFYEKLSEQQRIPFKEAFVNRIKTKMMSSSASNVSPTNSFTFNNNLFQILLQHL